MVNAIDGVPVCIPEDIVDPEHGINIQAGTREIAGREALNYVRARYTLGDGSDIGRIKRQQAFIAAMANKVISAGTLARVDRLVASSTPPPSRSQSTSSRTRRASPSSASASRASGSTTSSSSRHRTSTTRATRSSRAGSTGRTGSDELWEQISNDEPLSKEFTERLRSAPGRRARVRARAEAARAIDGRARQRAEAATGLCA